MNFPMMALMLAVVGLLLIHNEYNPSEKTLSERVGAEIWVDPETKCQYFTHDGVGGTRQPRLNRDGKPMCD